MMKLISARLQPVMESLISKNQTTFMKGRSIADNMILMREVIHSFNTPNFKQKAFLLKIDVNKAFNMVRWKFVEAAMRAVNNPNMVVKIVMNAMASSRVTIQING